MAIIEFTPPNRPRKGEVLFRSDPARRYADAKVGRLQPSGPTDPPLSEGYRMAARALSELAGTESDYHRSYLVWPIVFNYRHHVELILKRILMAIAGLADEPFTHKHSKDRDNHRLDALWADVKHFLKNDEVRNRWFVKISADDRDGVDDYIGQISRVDPDSQSFRYPRGKQGQPLLPEDLTCINVAVFSEHMERLCTFLDDLDSYLDAMLGNRNELYELQPECEDYSDAE